MGSPAAPVCFRGLGCGGEGSPGLKAGRACCCSLSMSCYHRGLLSGQTAPTESLQTALADSSPGCLQTPGNFSIHHTASQTQPPNPLHHLHTVCRSHLYSQTQPRLPAFPVYNSPVTVSVRDPWAPAVSPGEIAGAVALLRFTLHLGLPPDYRSPGASTPLLDQV